MEEKELISKIRELRQIRPRKDWVILAKHQIFSSSSINFRKIWLDKEKLTHCFTLSSLRILFLKPVYVSLLCILILFSLFGFAQNSLPGDILYPIKKITEKSQAVFVSEEEKSKYNLELANKRVEELNKIVQTNQVQKLAPAIEEVQNSFSQVTKNLVKSKKVDRETIDNFVNLKQNLKKAETILSTKITTPENEEVDENLEKNIVENLIKELENNTLTEKQEELLVQMKELVKEEKYSQALELYLLNQEKY